MNLSLRFNGMFFKGLSKLSNTIYNVKMDKAVVLIQTNKYYSKESWLSAIKKNFSNKHLQRINFIFEFRKTKLIFLIPRCDVCFCYGLSKFIDLEHSRLSMIYFGQSGLESIAERKLPNHISVHSCQGLTSRSIAQHTLMASLILIHKFQNIFINQQKKRWCQKELIPYPFKPLKDFSIGILGVGNNGQSVAELFKNVGCHILGYDIKPCLGNDNIDEWCSDINEILLASDIIIICLPLNKNTYHLIDIAKLNIIGSESFLINTARGEIINENDLIEALNKSYIKGAFIDTVADEPLGSNSKLWKIPGLIISPHIFGNVNNFIDAVQEDFLSKVRLFLGEF